MRHGGVLACALLLGAALCGACGPAAGRDPSPVAAVPDAGGPDAPLPPLPQKIAVAYSSVSSNFVPVWLAADAGLFARQGLDAEVTYISSGTTSLQSMVGGDVQFVAT